MRTRTRLFATAVVAVTLHLGIGGAASSASAGNPAPEPPRESAARLVGRDWIWPVTGFRLVRPFVAPAHRYGAGHRGIDVALFGSTTLRAPADGVVAFTGWVVDRGVLTIDHGNGLVSSFEPITVAVGLDETVSRGQPLGQAASGGHSPVGTVHFGVRLHGEYINPMLLLGAVPRAVLLPCCD